MKPISPHELSRRERQVLDSLSHLKEASAVQVLKHLPDPPGTTTVRKWLWGMEEKGLVQHRRQGRTFFYSAKVQVEEVQPAAALMNANQTWLSHDDCALLLTLIGQAEREGR